MEANTLTENSRTKNLARALISRKVPKLIERAIRDEIANLGFSVVDLKPGGPYQLVDPNGGFSGMPGSLIHCLAIAIDLCGGSLPTRRH